jgi:hypothetical protein
MAELAEKVIQARALPLDPLNALRQDGPAMVLLDEATGAAPKRVRLFAILVRVGLMVDSRPPGAAQYLKSFGRQPSAAISHFGVQPVDAPSPRHLYGPR